MATAPGANLLARYNAGTASPNKLNLGSILNYSLGQEKLAYDREKELQEAQDASDRTAALSGILKGMGSQGFDRLGSEQTEAILMQNPDYAKLSDEAKLTARNQFIQNNPGLAADPRLFKGHLRDSLAGVTNQRGQRLFSVEDIDNIVDTQYKRRYPGMSDQQLEAMTKVITEANKGGNKIFNIVPGADGGVQVSSGRGGSGTFRGQYNVGNPQDRLDMAKSVGELRNLSRTPWTVPIAGNRIDFGNLDPAVTDVADVMGRMATLPGENAIVSSSAMEAALDVAFNPDQTVKEKYDWRTPEGFKNLHQKALEAQRAETQKFNTKTGSAQSADQLVQSLAGQLGVGGGTQNAINQLNALFAQAAPRQLTDQELADRFIASLGFTPAEAAAAVEETKTQPPATQTTQPTANSGTDAVNEVMSAVTGNSLLSADSQPEDIPATPEVAKQAKAEATKIFDSGDQKQLTEKKKLLSDMGNIEGRTEVRRRNTLQKEITELERKKKLATMAEVMSKASGGVVKLQDSEAEDNSFVKLFRDATALMR